MAGALTSEVPSFLNPGQTGAGSTAEQRFDVSREQFFKILIAQLQAQDPMEPLSNQDFMGQLAQLESLNTQAKMTEGMGKLTDSIRFSQLNDASSMLGNVIDGTVHKQLMDGDGHPAFDPEGNPLYQDAPVQGLATRVLSNNGKTQLVLLVPVIDSQGSPVFDTQGNLVTREETVDISTVTQITDPMIAAQQLGASK